MKTGRGEDWVGAHGWWVEVPESWSTCNCLQSTEARTHCVTLGRGQTKRYRKD